MALSSNLGFPRIGVKRELKRAVEDYWAGKINENQLEETASNLRKINWKLQQEAGIDLIPSNDFSLYDQVLDTAVLVGAIPPRYHWSGGPVSLDTYFAMARGADGDDGGIPAMEMTKWYDTNYHYIVPELTADQTFELAGDKPVREFQEALELGIKTKPVIIGPVTFLLLSKPRGDSFPTLSLLDAIIPVYEKLLQQLQDAGAEWVQLDEPALVTDLDDSALNAFRTAYERLAASVSGLKLKIATYFGDLGSNLETALHLPVDALHLDLTRDQGQLERALAVGIPDNLSLSLGVVDGRNVWVTDWQDALHKIDVVKQSIGAERIIIGPSCSLLHVPIDLSQETNLDDELRQWIAFAKEKLIEIATITTGVTNGRESIAQALETNERAVKSRRESTRIHRQTVNERLAQVTDRDTKRGHQYPERAAKQSARLRLPLIPTTTIGSFPQTPDVRQARAQFKAGELSQQAYDSFLEERVRDVISRQEEIGLDVLVHGEFERNDMVEYFGERLDGFAVTNTGWVQSYGSRCVKPPIIYGDVSRPAPMTVKWSEFAQSLTAKPVKGMLTGPVTILEWSFVRDDQPHETTCKQIALALRDEVLDLEAAGLSIIQVDEPALREGLPLRREEWADYLNWSVDSFRLATAGVKDETQIHTHMCYSEFNDIMEAIARLDADVISIEASRSDMELLDAFVDFHYPNEIGPGVYDIHSPRIPTADEQASLLKKALDVFPARQLWANPDCGLKTRGWDEVTTSLINLVQATEQVREQLS